MASGSIAMLATLIDHRGALHHAHLAESVSPFSEATRLRVAQLAAGLQARGLDASDAVAGAHKLIEQTQEVVDIG